jgi:Fe2+ transport system protein FeoA
MKKISLIHLKEDHKARIIDITGGAALRNRMMSLGIYPGRDVSKLSHIGLRGPVVLKVGRSILALGHGVAAKIIVESA